MRGVLSLAIIFASLLGCESELPPLDYRGERVRVGSDKVEQVCEGTLARIDREVEQIESRLDLPIQDRPLDVYIVDHDAVGEYCPGAGNCTWFPSDGTPFVLVDHLLFERAIAHELVHARLAAITSVPLFDEGIAQALSPPRCPRPTPDIELSDILAAKTSDDWPDKWVTYYAAGELLAWLIEEFGAAAVLSLMQSVTKSASPSTINTEYAEHFGRELAVDMLTHLRTQADVDALPPEYFGCLATPVDASEAAAHLIADLDCDSGRVHNNFGVDGTGYVEWTLHLDHEQTLKLAGAVPFGTSLTIEECGCLPTRGEDDDEYRLARSFQAFETLQPGAYRLRWTGELDVGLSLDIELEPLHDD
jgi:hypothetical protein